MQQRFLLQILLLAQHVSGITMPIIRSSRVLYSGCCLWYFVLWFSSCWSGMKLRVMCPVCWMLQHPDQISQTLICGNKMPTRCNRDFYCKSYCLLDMFRAPLCPSSGAQEYYTVVADCGISCCGFQVAGLQDAAASCKPDT